MKWQIEMFLARAFSLGIGNLLDITNLLTTVILTSVIMGISFQFPIALLIIIRMGIIDHQHLRRKRFWIYLGFFLFSILLPCDSVLTDIFLTLPLIILFELVLIGDNILRERREIPPAKKL
jgi:sec-independent protein translocase protein TatC